MTMSEYQGQDSFNMREEIDPTRYGIDKTKAADLMGHYDHFFAPMIGKGIDLFELGVARGASLRYWRDYFGNANIVGLDRNVPADADLPNMIHVYQGYQQDIELLDHIAEEQAPEGFDVIIDDCAHIGRLARISFWHLFQNHLKPGGVYAIEDWGTGYWPWSKWPDGGRYRPKSHLAYSRREQLLDALSQRLSRTFPGCPWLAQLPARLFVRSTIRTHDHGMVGFVKELLDVCSQGEAAIPRSGSGRYLDYGISQIHINRWLVIVQKSE